MTESLSLASLARALAFTCAALVLTSCSDSGPSRSEAADAITKQATAEVAGMFPNAQIKVEVDDLKCAKTGDGIFDCQVLMTATGPGGTKQSAVAMQFTKLGGEWHVKPTPN